MTLPARRNGAALTAQQKKAARILSTTLDLAQAKLEAARARIPARKVDELLGDPLVLLEAERILMTEQAPLRRMRVMKQLEQIAFADPGELFTTDRRGRLTPKPFNDLTPQQRALIQHLRITPTAWGRTTDLKLLDKMAVLNLLARIDGLTTDGGTKVGIQIHNSEPTVEEIRVVYVSSNNIHEPEGIDGALTTGPDLETVPVEYDIEHAKSRAR